MTIKEYIVGKFEAFNISEAILADVMTEAGLDIEQDYGSDVSQSTGEAMCRICEELVFAPKLKSVSEGGMSLSWDMSSLGKYYLWLCRRYGRKPNKDTLGMMDMSVIIDRTSSW